MKLSAQRMIISYKDIILLILQAVHCYFLAVFAIFSYCTCSSQEFHLSLSGLVTDYS